MLAAQAVTSRKGKQYGGVHGGAAGRVLAERTQIYERLSLSSHGSAERIRSIFARFSIPLKEKKKKAALTESVCESFDALQCPSLVIFF